MDYSKGFFGNILIISFLQYAHLAYARNQILS